MSTADLAGALDLDELYSLLAAAGYEDPDVQVVCSYGIADLKQLAASTLAELRLDALPAADLAAAEGRVVSVFVRGRNPATMTVVRIAGEGRHGAS